MGQSASYANCDSAPRNQHPKGFEHRTLVGWISEFSSRPLHEPWPVITLDNEMMSDFYELFDTNFSF